MQYLVMKNRIINLAYRDVEINQPMPRSTDNATVSVQATQSEKYPTRFFRDRLKNVNALSSHLAESLTTRCSLCRFTLLSNLCTPVPTRATTPNPQPPVGVSLGVPTGTSNLVKEVI